MSFYDDEAHRPPEDVTDADWQDMCRRAYQAEAALEAWWESEHGDKLAAKDIVQLLKEIPAT